MKLKKLIEVLPPFEKIRVWGKDEEVPLYYGFAENVPSEIKKLKIETRDPLAYGVEVRYGCADIEDHIAIQVEEI